MLCCEFVQHIGQEKQENASLSPYMYQFEKQQTGPLTPGGDWFIFLMPL
jgi:hypothetical protein